jgi:flagellar basal-body rod modification protein FlgD
MTSTSAVGSTSSALIGSSSATSSTKSAQLTEQDFLKLMTQQLKNQDPMHPTDNSEFFSQIAQFSTVSGIDTLNTAVSKLSTQLSSSQSVQAAALVGRNVLVQGASGYLGADGLSGAVEVPASGDVTIRITDSAGAVVRTIAMGTQAAGTSKFTWDGLTDAGAAAPVGTYSLTAAVNGGGLTQSATTDVQALVQGVEFGASGSLLLNLQGVGSVALSKVLEVS